MNTNTDTTTAPASPALAPRMHASMLATAAFWAALAQIAEAPEIEGWDIVDREIVCRQLLLQLWPRNEWRGKAQAPAVRVGHLFKGARWERRLDGGWEANIREGVLAGLTVILHDVEPSREPRARGDMSIDELAASATRYPEGSE